MDEENKSNQAVEDIPMVDAAGISNVFSADDSSSPSEEDTSTVPNHDIQESTEDSASDDDHTDVNSDQRVSVDETISVDESVIPQSNTNDVSAIDRSARQNAIDSDKDYRRITEKIIDKTCDQLKEHTGAKAPLRKTLSNFIIFLLTSQFLVLVGILFFNRKWDLQITDFILNIYIVSVFVETLAGLIIMIKFAFDSQQEVELIKILNAIITNFKKYDEK